jgi:tetraacyldisaccharide 4'-kinase
VKSVVEKLEEMVWGEEEIPLFLKFFLLILSRGYLLLLRIHSFLYRCRILRSKKLRVRVISVGNITLGGTGKTLAVLNISKILRKQGYKVAILTRGYGGSGEGLRVMSKGGEVLLGKEKCGDEPYLLAKNLRDVAILVNRNRVKAANFAISSLQSDTLVLDDGFQYRALARDLDIVLINCRKPFGNGKLFPLGSLREPLESLERANVFLLTKINQSRGKEEIISRLRKINPQAKIIESIYLPLDLIDLHGSAHPLDTVKGRNVLALSGIADHQFFENMLLDVGANIVRRIRYPDHYSYKKEDVERISEVASSEEIDFIVTTEKDGVRLEGLEIKESILCLRVELKIVKGLKDWEALILDPSRRQNYFGNRFIREEREQEIKREGFGFDQILKNPK